MPAERTIYLLRQACLSLAEAEAHGLVHRDIKPANLFACRLGGEHDFVKVLDFGLVKYNKSSMQQTLMSSSASAANCKPAVSSTQRRRSAADSSGTLRAK